MLSNTPSSSTTPAGAPRCTHDPTPVPAPVATSTTDDDLWAPRVPASANTLTLADLNRELESLRSAVLDRASALDLDAVHEDRIEVVPDTTSDAALMDVAELLQAMESADEWLGVLDGRFDALNAQLDALLGALGEDDEEGERSEGEREEEEEVEEEVGDVGETVVAEAAKRVAVAMDADAAITVTVGPRKPLALAAAGVEVAQVVVAEEAK
ncbi:hypothetical protein AMAG_12943 [Allomyces macrogynus ATCC 38327]|uniref:Uncharacterized protein n=1 Tax=Allomyces macrogynus (strain ATCC 38327) TaxID=578462 RepID=A0A0L0T0G0_ALLM3|nr:hypothetical protein AMAG_12943 [Allomyces macrogynus ATCC 38327]|eukprot:KNE68273.1 hypothetical protein AMAG_12943 [Allomyces macrogynus ATCC 38327]